ncbi:MAG: hypothetical protein WC071_06335 [Victivallaceae bacterium]
MKKNSVLNKFSERPEKCLDIRIGREYLAGKLFYVAKNVPEAFLFGKRSNFIC